MSFGWSAGDIAAVISLAYNIIEALDSCDGAAGDYREAVSFLRDLKRTLEPLQTYTTWRAYPSYGADIEEQVKQIREPVQTFLKAVVKYEPGLGATAKEGHHRHVFRKLQWHVLVSKKVLALKKSIESHMRVIDTLLQRLTLDIVYSTQQQLPETLRTVFESTLRPGLLAFLRENLLPLHASLLANSQQSPNEHHEAILTKISKLSEHYQSLSADVELIKQHISNPSSIRRQVESGLHCEATSPQDFLAGTNCLLIQESGQTRRINEHTRRKGDGATSENDYGTNGVGNSDGLQESLGTIYYMIFVYLGHFLKNLFQVLAQSIRPARALMPILDPKYHISFLDPLGSLPRVLQHESFRSFQILQAFIANEFKNLPGSSLVNQGRYQIMSLANNRSISNRFLNELNWSQSVVPGSTIAMSMVIRKTFETSSEAVVNYCPYKDCYGTWPKSAVPTWAKCPECHKDVFTSPFTPLHDLTITGPVKEKTLAEVVSEGGRVELLDIEWYERAGNSSPTRIIQEADDISLFTRIIQEIHEFVRRAQDLHDDVLLEAARNIDIDDLSWPMLKMFLKGTQVDITTRTPQQWMTSLFKVRSHLRKEINEGRHYGYEEDEDEDVELASNLGSEETVRAYRTQLYAASGRNGQPVQERPSREVNNTTQSGSSGQQTADDWKPKVLVGAADGPGPFNLFYRSTPDEKLLEALEYPRDRIFLLRLEADVISFVKDSKEPFIDLPPCNSFCRMLTHKLADYFHMTHQVDSVAGTVRIFRTPFVRLPPTLMTISNPPTTGNTPPPSLPAMKIMRRGGDRDELA